jgi:hypothetical protein
MPETAKDAHPLKALWALSKSQEADRCVSKWPVSRPLAEESDVFQGEKEDIEEADLSFKGFRNVQEVISDLIGRRDEKALEEHPYLCPHYEIDDYQSFLRAVKLYMPDYVIYKMSELGTPSNLKNIKKGLSLRPSKERVFAFCLLLKLDCELSSRLFFFFGYGLCPLESYDCYLKETIEKNAEALDGPDLNSIQDQILRMSDYSLSIFPLEDKYRYIRQGLKGKTLKKKAV